MIILELFVAVSIFLYLSFKTTTIPKKKINVTQGPVNITHLIDGCIHAEVNGFHLLALYKLLEPKRIKNQFYPYLIEYNVLNQSVNDENDLDYIYDVDHSAESYHLLKAMKPVIDNKKSFFDIFDKLNLTNQN